MDPRRERRRHPRCNLEREIVFSTGSQTELRYGVTKNYSRFNLYFESATALVPGTLLFIRTKTDEGAPMIFADVGNPVETARHTDTDTDDQDAVACSVMKNLVVAQVMRCEKIAGSGESVYGTGVAYISPAV